MSTITKGYRGYITRAWWKPVLRRWGWEVCEGEARLAAGEHVRIDFALSSARQRVDQIVAWERENSCQNVADSADRKGGTAA